MTCQKQFILKTKADISELKNKFALEITPIVKKNISEKKKVKQNNCDKRKRIWILLQF